MKMTQTHKGHTYFKEYIEQQGCASTELYNSLGQHTAEERHIGPQLLREGI